MESVKTWFEQQLMGNSVGNLVLFALLILLGLWLKRILSMLLSRFFYRLVKPESNSIPISDFLRLMRQPIEFLILLIMLFLAFDRLAIPDQWGFVPRTEFGYRLVVIRLYQTTLMITLAWIAIRFVKFVGLIFQKRAEQTETKLDDQLVPFVRDLMILTVSAIAFFSILSVVFDVNVIALVTSLGIGGLAIALAARETLENLFASFAILLDRPFVTGDTVTAGTGPNQVTGTVEKIGFRSTRLRTDDGSRIAVPNRLMISQSLDNLTQRSQRRAKFYLRLALDTPAETLRGIVDDTRQWLENQPKTNQSPPLIQFDTFGESSLDILIQYYVATSDYREFNAIKEEVNYQLIAIVKKHSGQFAFPSRIVYLRSQAEFPLENQK
ncbi:mechanosensitive ion channel family protein [Larkinella punicea]|uniref:Mechanosensitive ion channel family protein n=1 Tax=Larkinella punicea TaxID=2315727 RepID=A0A368JQF1_9BACT|nr:mechanosensitive ion channel family protein [Larkinella punicea]RCR69545.1 mechanosensitive ion channel family protein [Larkinella punicea]